MNAEEKMQQLEERIENLEKIAHSDHTLSQETIQIISDYTIKKVNEYLKKLFDIGSILLKDESK